MNLKNIIVSLVVSLLLSACAGSGPHIYNIPMYGQPEIEVPERAKKANDWFIEQAVKQYGSREKASIAWWNEAERYMNEEGNLDYAMRRYNQSWLLNPNNYQPYWGFARVAVATGKDDEAIKYFKKAKELVNDPYQESGLLTDMAIPYHNKAVNTPFENSSDRKAYFQEANNLLEKGTLLDPKYANTWFVWAFTLYYQGDYSASWEKAKKAQELDPKSVPEDFIKKLKSKYPNP